MKKKIKTSQENFALCHGCDDCCRYIAVEIDRPTTKMEFENIRWFLLHENVSVSVSFNNNWYLEFKTNCKALKNRRCSVYDKRPQMCRDYDQKECTRYNSEPAEKLLFKNVKQFEKYLRDKKNKKINIAKMKL